jgi:hypothetical protein
MESKRESLSANLVKSLRFHFKSFRDADLSKFSVERRKSSYQGAKVDIVIFDAEGAAVVKWREFGGGQMSLWAE